MNGMHRCRGGHGRYAAALSALLVSCMCIQVIGINEWYEASQCDAQQKSGMLLAAVGYSKMVAGEVHAKLSLSRQDGFNTIIEKSEFEADPHTLLETQWSVSDAVKQDVQDSESYALVLALSCQEMEEQVVGPLAARAEMQNSSVGSNEINGIDEAIKSAAYYHWNYSETAADVLDNVNFKIDTSDDGLRSMFVDGGDGSLQGQVQREFLTDFDFAKSVAFVVKGSNKILATCCDMTPNPPKQFDSNNDNSVPVTVWTSLSVDRVDSTKSVNYEYSYPVSEVVSKPTQAFFFTDFSNNFYVQISNEDGRMIFKNQDNKPSLFVVDNPMCYDSNDIINNFPITGEGQYESPEITFQNSTMFRNQMLDWCQNYLAAENPEEYASKNTENSLNYKFLCDGVQTLTYMYDVFSLNAAVPFSPVDYEDVLDFGNGYMAQKESKTSFGDFKFSTPISHDSIGVTDSWEKKANATLSFTFPDFETLMEGAKEVSKLYKGNGEDMLDYWGTSSMLDFFATNREEYLNVKDPITFTMTLDYSSRAYYSTRSHSTGSPKAELFFNRPLSKYVVTLHRNVSVVTDSKKPFWSTDSQHAEMKFLSQTVMPSVTNKMEADDKLFNPCWYDSPQISVENSFNVLGVNISADYLGGIFSFMAPAKVTGGIEGCNCKKVYQTTDVVMQEITKSKNIAAGTVALIVILVILMVGSCCAYGFYIWMKKRRGFRWMKINEDGILEMTPAAGRS